MRPSGCASQQQHHTHTQLAYWQAPASICAGQDLICISSGAQLGSAHKHSRKAASSGPAEGCPLPARMTQSRPVHASAARPASAESKAVLRPPRPASAGGDTSVCSSGGEPPVLELRGTCASRGQSMGTRHPPVAAVLLLHRTLQGHLRFGAVTAASVQLCRYAQRRPSVRRLGCRGG